MNIWKPLTFVAREWRMQVLAELIEKNLPIEKCDGAKIILEKNDRVIKSLKSYDIKEFNKVKHLLRDIHGNRVPISHIGKTLIFGGKGIGNCNEVVEEQQIISLNNQFKKLGIITISIQENLHRKMYKAKKVKAGEKADIEILNTEEQPKIWISHKAGKTPKHFQQWGGVLSLLRLKQYKELQNFANDVDIYITNSSLEKTRLVRAIRNNKIKMVSVYGLSFSKEDKNFGPQNVTLIVQGNIILRKQNRYFEITSEYGDNFVHYNGNKLTKDYEPTLMARFDSQRRHASSMLSKTRLLIVPKGSINFKNEKTIKI